MTDTNKLKELAERATPGQWRTGDGEESLPDCVLSGEFVICEHAGDDVDFIAAANPQAILGLIADLEDARNGMEYQPIMRLKSELDRLKAENEALRSALKPFAEYERVRSEIGGNAPRTGTLFGVNTRAGDAEITVEDMRAAQAALEGGGK